MINKDLNKLTATDFVFDEEGPIFNQMSILRIVKYKGRIPMVIHNGGHLSVVFEIKGVDSSNFDSNDFKNFLSNFELTQEATNEDISISFTAQRRPYKPKDIQTNIPLLQARLEYFKERELKETVYYITLFCKNKKESLLARSLNLKTLKEMVKKTKEKFNNSDFENLLQRGMKLELAIESLSSKLNSLKMDYRLFESELEYKKMLHSFYSVRIHEDDIGNDPEETPSSSFRKNLLEGIRVDTFPNHFEINGDVFKLFVLDRVPTREVLGGDVGVFLNMPYEYVYTISSRAMNEEESLDKFSRVVKGASSMRDDERKRGLNRDIIKDKNFEHVASEYESWAYTQEPLAEASVNLFVKLSKEELAERQRIDGISKQEVLIRFENHIIDGFLNKFHGSRWGVEGESAWFVYNKTVPSLTNLGATELKKTILLRKNVPYMTGIWSAGDKSKHDGFNHLFDEYGSFVSFDPYRGPDNYNGVISGGSGSGKSVLMCTLLEIALGKSDTSNPPLITILDNSGENGSYYALGMLFGATVINFSSPKRPTIPIFEVCANPLLCIPKKNKRDELISFIKASGCKEDEGRISSRINTFYAWLIAENINKVSERMFSDQFKEVFGVPPRAGAKELFVLKEGECKPFQKSLSLATALVKTIFSSSGIKFESAFVEGIVSDLYEKIEGRFPTMTDLYEFLDEDLEDSSEKTALMKVVRNWTRTGVNYYFDGELDVDLDNNFIIADLKGLESEPTIASVYSLLFNELFSQKHYYSSGSEKYFVRDEAWKLSEDPLSARYMNEDYKTARKNKISSWMLIQSIPEMLDKMPAFTAGILENADHIIVGKISGAHNISKLKSALEIPDKMMRIAFDGSRSLGKQIIKNSKKEVVDVYSRYLFKIGKEFLVLTNRLSPFELATFSSSPADYHRRIYYMNVVKIHRNISDYLTFVSEGKHKGDKGLAKYLWDCSERDEAIKIYPNIANELD